MPRSVLRTGVELVGVVDAHAETAQRVAKELGVAALPSTRLLAGGKIDLVSVASTTETHHAVARGASPPASMSSRKSRSPLPWRRPTS